MNNYLLLLIVVIFNCYSLILAENNYYIVSIRRDKNDKDYDDASKKVQNAIDELVNERMNDIYRIISENKDTFVLDNGKKDEKLEELESTKLKKRNNNKIRFVNRNRRQIFKRSTEEVELKSHLVSHLCPVLNYYTIIAYLSDAIVDEVKKLPNVIDCQKSQYLKKMSIKTSASSNKSSYYDLNSIKKETNWSGVKVQEHKYTDKDYEDFTHLSLISQDRYNNSNTVYDNNYYYPSSAGKGVDIFFIDEGLWMNHEDFDTYNGERTITCDALVYDGSYHSVKDKNKCAFTYYTDSNNKNKKSFDFYPEHGVMVSSASAGKIYGVAKKANIHMITTEFSDYDYILDLDYIKQHGKPHKTVVNISSGGLYLYNENLQNKINELTKNGIIIVVSAGNEKIDLCEPVVFNNEKHVLIFQGYDNVIKVGALSNEIKNEETERYFAADYSNYGKCIDIHAPGKVTVANSENDRTSKHVAAGTSCAAPLVAGVVANIISENPDIKYNYESMKEKLIQMSIKNAIVNLKSSDTPNRLLNNGKKSIYEPFRCDDPSGKYKCSSGCCGADGKCIEIKESNSSKLYKCLIEKGCRSEFGKCVSLSSKPSSTSSKESKLVIKKTCDYEYEKLDDICHFTQSYTIDNFERFEEICSLYDEYRCTEFYKDPLSVLESCKYAKKNYNYKLPFKSYDNMEKEEITHNFFCTKENKNNYCKLSYKVMYYEDDEKSSLLDAIKESCKTSQVCTNAYYNYIEYLIKYYKKEEAMEAVKYFKGLKNVLLDNHCVTSSKSVTTTTRRTKTSTRKIATTTRKTTITTRKTTNTTRKIATTTTKKTSRKTTSLSNKTVNKNIPISTVFGRCGPKYGACSKSGYCCSKYGYCGKTERYCGKDCLSEFGVCSS